MAPTSALTQRERDSLQEQGVEALLDHEGESAKRHSDLTARLDKIEATQQRILDALNLLNTSPWGLLLRLVDRATASTIGTVALLSLIAISMLIAASVYLGADHVLEIVAGRVSLGTPSPDPAPEAP
jgi:hypothetical protein